MKKSRIAKLALMGASITALAATLTTSTYAWYVTNNKADIAAVTGSTASASAAGSISLSATGVVGSFKKSLTLSSFSTASLSPVITTDGKTFKELNTATGSATTDVTVAKTGYGASDSGKVYCYRFFVLAEGATEDDDTTDKNESQTIITPKVTLVNTTATTAFKTQINYSGTALSPNTIGAGDSFYANALNAMSMSSAKYQGTALVSTLTDDDKVTAAYSSATTLNSVDQLSETMTAGDANRYATSIATGTGKGFPENAKIATAGARAYYDAISEVDLQADAKAQFSGTKLSTITLDNMKPMLLEFYLWLDGADDACYNACETQAFSVEFEFQVKA